MPLLLPAFETPPTSPVLRPTSPLELNSPPKQHCFCGQMVPYEEDESTDGLYCSRKCAHQSTMSSLLGTSAAASPVSQQSSPRTSSSSSSSFKTLPQTPPHQIIRLDTFNPPSAPLRVRNRSPTPNRDVRATAPQSSLWSDLDESPLMDTSSSEFETDVYLYDSEEEEEKNEDHLLRTERGRGSQGKLGTALFGTKPSTTSNDLSNKAKPTQSSPSNQSREFWNTGQVRDMDEAAILAMNLSLRLGLSQDRLQSREDGDESLDHKEAIGENQEKEKGSSDNFNLDLNLRRANPNIRHNSTVTSTSASTSSCPTPLVSQQAYHPSVLAPASSGTVNLPSPPHEAASQPKLQWSSPQFSDGSGSSESTEDSMWEMDSLDVGNQNGNGNGTSSERSESFSSSSVGVAPSLYSRSRATTVSSQDHHNQSSEIHSKCDGQHQNETASSLSKLQASTRRIPNFDAFEFDTDDEELGFEEVDHELGPDSQRSFSPGYRHFNNFLEDRSIQSFINSSLVKTHQKSQSSSSSYNRTRKNQSLSIHTTSISSPTLIQTSLCPSTFSTCRDLRRPSHSPSSSNHSSAESAFTLRSRSKPSSSSNCQKKVNESKGFEINQSSKTNQDSSSSRSSSNTKFVAAMKKLKNAIHN